MSFITSEYTRRVCANKTIVDVSQSDGATKILFTDGSYLILYPHSAVKHTGNSVAWEAQIITNGYDRDGEVIPAISFEEAGLT